MMDVDLLAKAVTWMDTFTKNWACRRNAFFPTVGVLLFDDPAGGESPHVLINPVVLEGTDKLTCEMTEDLQRFLVKKMQRTVRENQAWGLPRIGCILTPTSPWFDLCQRPTRITMFLGSLTRRYMVAYQIPLTWRTDDPGPATFELAGSYKLTDVPAPPLFEDFLKAFRRERAAVLN